ncbi:MAG TPA: hypothetical protein VIC26_03690 [Marinagarivorans sp.]
MKNTLITLSISSFLLTLSACGSSDNESTSNPSAENSSSALTQTSSNANSQTSQLDGVWFKDCTAEDTSDPDTFYETVEITFANGNIASDIHIYTDSMCSNPMPLAPNPTAKGTFIIGASFTSGDGITVQELDVQLTEVNGAPFDERSYNIFYIDGDQLYMGEDAEIPEERPTMLDFTLAFIKQ